jgi:hypothetical protein
MNYDNITFSHRPVLGVSVGAFQESPGVIVLAAAIVNVNSEDTHSGLVARRIIRNRIRDLVEGRQRVNGRALSRFVTRIEVPESMTATDLMNRLRSVFKPTPDESDDGFFEFIDSTVLDIQYRIRMEADAIWTSIVEQAKLTPQVSL